MRQIWRMTCAWNSLRYIGYQAGDRMANKGVGSLKCFPHLIQINLLTKILYAFLFSSQVPYVTAHLVNLEVAHPINIIRGVHIARISELCNFLQPPVTSLFEFQVYFSTPVLVHYQRTFFPWCERPGFTPLIRQSKLQLFVYKLLTKLNQFIKDMK